MSELNDAVLKDLLDRVQKLENNPQGVKKEIEDTIVGLDSVAYTLTIAIQALTAVFLEKKLVTGEELSAAAQKERERIANLMRSSKEEKKDELKPDTSAEKTS